MNDSAVHYKSQDRSPPTGSREKVLRGRQGGGKETFLADTG